MQLELQCLTLNTKKISRQSSILLVEIAVQSEKPLHCNFSNRQVHLKALKILTMADKLKETAKQEIEQIKNVASEGVRSGAYVYPIKAS